MNRLLWFRPRCIFLSILFLATLMVALSLGGCFVQAKPLVIAVSMGTDEPIDRGVDEAIKGIEDYIQEVNQAGGIKGKPLKLEYFNDGNDPEQVIQTAQDIAQNSNALVVLGHYYSSTSLEAGKIYQKFGIPAITGGATADEITQGNPWYFRTLLHGSAQADFLTFYLKEVLDYSTLSLIYDSTEAYSASFKNAVEKGAQRHQVTIGEQWDIAASNDQERDQKIQNIVAAVPKANPEQVGAVGILLTEEPASMVVAALKRQGLPYPIVGGDALSSETFIQRFQNYPEERQNPGYFTNGIYSFSHVIFDVLGEEAQEFKRQFTEEYDQEPGWVAATFYNSAKVAVEALKRAEVTGNPSSLDQERQQVRDAIASINSLDNAVSGLNGPLYFDSQGNIIQSATISSTINNQLVSALGQLTAMRSTQSQEKLDAELAQDKIIKFGQQYLNRTDVIYTGVRPRQITNLDLGNKTCQLDFDLWFRYRNPKKSQLSQLIVDLDFLNAIDDIKLDEPITHMVNRGVAYDLYQVSGTFNLDFLDHERDFGEHILGISFINHQVSQDHFIYVIDSLGLGMTLEQPFVEILQADQVLSKKTGWKIKKATFFQDSIAPETLGNPKVLESRHRNDKFSRFNLAMTIARDQLSFRRTMSLKGASYLLGFWGILMVILRRQKWQLSPSLLWCLGLALSLLFLFATEDILIESLKQGLPVQILEWMVMVFDTLWWIVPAYFVGELLEILLWKPLKQRTGQPVPTLVHRLVLTLLYLLTLFGVVAYVFNRPLTSLLATSGLALTIVGLAVQINISNIFSGLAINLEQTFKVGDYIEVADDEIQGYVTDITWRATHLETTSGNTILIPNSVINDKTIINYMRPQKISCSTLTFTLTQATSTERAIQAFQQAIATSLANPDPSPLSEPPPGVLVGGTDSLGVVYELSFWHIPSDPNFGQIRDLVVQNVLKCLQAENIELACEVEG